MVQPSVQPCAHPPGYHVIRRGVLTCQACESGGAGVSAPPPQTFKPLLALLN